MATSVDQAAAAAAAPRHVHRQAQYEAMEQKLYKAVECKLEQSGVMAALKGSTARRHLAAMVEPSPGEQASTAEKVSKAAARPTSAGTRRRLPRVRRPDARVVRAGSDVGLEDERVHPDVVLAPQTRSKLRDDVGLPAVPSKIPLLCELLEHGAQPVPKLDPSLSLSSSMPLPASTAAKLEPRAPPLYSTCSRPRTPTSASASFEEASISPRASYGDASFESESPRAVAAHAVAARVAVAVARAAALPRRPDDSRCVDCGRGRAAASASETPCSVVGGLGGASGSVRLRGRSMFGGEAHADTTGAGARRGGRVRGLHVWRGRRGAGARLDDDGSAAAPPRPRADDRGESASASDSSGAVSFAEDSEADAAPAPRGGRRPSTRSSTRTAPTPPRSARRRRRPGARSRRRPRRRAPRPRPLLLPSRRSRACRRAGGGRRRRPPPGWRPGRTLTTTSSRTSASSRTVVDSDDSGAPARRRILPWPGPRARWFGRGRADAPGAMSVLSTATTPGSARAIAVRPSSSKSPMALALLTCGFQITASGGISMTTVPSVRASSLRRARPPSRPRAARRSDTFCDTPQ